VKEVRKMLEARELRDVRKVRDAKPPPIDFKAILELLMPIYFDVHLCSFIFFI